MYIVLGYSNNILKYIEVNENELSIKQIGKIATFWNDIITKLKER